MYGTASVFFRTIRETTILTRLGKGSLISVPKGNRNQFKVMDEPTGKAALVMWGSRGQIGVAIAAASAECGADVALIDFEVCRGPGPSGLRRRLRLGGATRARDRCRERRSRSGCCGGCGRIRRRVSSA